VIVKGLKLRDCSVRGSYNQESDRIKLEIKGKNNHWVELHISLDEIEQMATSSNFHGHEGPFNGNLELIYETKEAKPSCVTTDNEREHMPQQKVS
jgi:hypothetical protein